jgi:2-polyprenyl-3-methyl-5-hydroxy-6-metoxy-1,4-benzoquinol methylase
VEKNYATQYHDLYRRHWWWCARECAILNEIKRLGLQPDGSCSILDIGCGDGLIFDALQPYGQVWGVEADAATLTAAGRWRHRIANQRFDVSYQPGRRYDLILMLDILEHLPDPESALSHARSLLKPHGKLLMTVPAFNLLWTTHDDLNHHYVRYTKHSFGRLANAAGVKLEQLRYFFHWTYPVKLAIRLRELLLRTRAAPPRVPPKVLNRLCFALSRFEQQTITRLGIPFGSSLLAIGTCSSCAAQKTST